jgi:hypothetical protein
VDDFANRFAHGRKHTEFGTETELAPFGQSRPLRPRYVDPWSTPSLDARRPTGSRTMPQRYDIREDREGWTVFDLFTGEPVVISDVPQTGLDIQDADELAELLDHKAFANDRTLRQ